ncbi:MAG: hypothetical protein KDA84_12825, partial [Planctomycetaceae bacterium]|nr:hypothetical protein [Planctomycetaceae bacterium]
EHPDPTVQTEAARTVCYRYPNHIPKVLPLLETSQGFAIAEQLCFCDSPKVLSPLLTYFQSTKTPFPPVLGFLLTPERLTIGLDLSNETVDQLLEEFGFVEPTVTGAKRNLIAEGFWFASDRMSQVETKNLRSRLAEFRWMLLPDSLGMVSKNPKWLDPRDPLDCDLFLAAVRESDRDNLTIWKSRNPFAAHTGRYRRVVACLHAPIRFARQLVFEEGHQLAKALNVPTTCLGQFLTERTRVLLEMDELKRVESDALFQTRWSVIHRMGVDTKDQVTWKKWPVEADADFPSAKRAVLKKTPSIPIHDELSPGAWSISNLADCWNGEPIRERLRGLEAAYAPFLLPIGIELQIPQVDCRINFAWRQ